MFAEEIRRQAEIVPQAALPAVTAALWRAYGEGKITEAEAEALSGLIEARTISAPRRRDNAGQPSTSSAEGIVIPHHTSGGLASSPKPRQGTQCRLAPADGWLAGAPPPLGRLGAAAAGVGRPVHAGRAGGPRPGGGRGRAAKGLPPRRRTSRRDRGRGRDHRPQRHPRGREARARYSGRTTGDRLPQRHQHPAHRVAGMDRLAAAGTPGPGFGKPAFACGRADGGRVQIRAGHAY